jgi:hypothetical protein
MDVIPRARAVNNALFFTGCYKIASCTHLEDCGRFYDALPSNRQFSSNDQELGNLLRQQYSSTAILYLLYLIGFVVSLCMQESIKVNHLF